MKIETLNTFLVLTVLVSGLVEASLAQSVQPETSAKPSAVLEVAKTLIAVTAAATPRPNPQPARTEKLREPAAFPVMKDGRKIGESKVAVGTAVTVLEEKDDQVLLKFGNFEPKWFPVSTVAEPPPPPESPTSDIWNWVIKPRFSQALPFDATGWARVAKGGKWGLIDLNGKEVLPLEYDEVKTYPDQRCAAFRKGDRWGLIDDNGRIVLQAEWEDVQPLIRGFIPVRRDGKWGYANAEGKLVIEPTWDDAWRFSPAGTAIVTLGTSSRDRKRGFIDTTGQVITPIEWDGAINHVAEGVGAVRRGNGWALVDKAGKLLTEPEWDIIWKLFRPDLGFIPVRKDRKWGIMRLDGSLKVEPEWWVLATADDGVMLLYGPNERKGAIFVGVGGEVLHRIDERDQFGPPGYRPFNHAQLAWRNDQHEFPAVVENLLPMRSGDKWGFIDKTGKVVIEPVWDNVGPVSEGVVAVWKKNGATSDSGEWQFLKTDGSVAFQLPEDAVISGRAVPRFRNGILRAYAKGGRGATIAINKNGKVLEGSGDDASGDSWLPPGLQIQGTTFPYVSRHGRYGYMRNLADSQGNILLRDVPVEVDSLEFPFPYAGPPRYGVISTEGKMVLQPVWDFVEFTDNGLLLASKDGKITVFDGTGKDVSPKAIAGAQFVDSYKKGFIAKSERPDGSMEWSLFEPTGTATPVKFENASRLYWNSDLAENGLLWAEDGTTGRWSLIKRDGTALGVEMAQQPAEWRMPEGFGLLRKDDGTVTLIDVGGKTLGDKPWEDAGIFRGGLAPVKTGGKWGFIDTTGKLIVPTELDEIAWHGKAGDKPWSAIVKRGGAWQAIDAKGTVQSELAWEEIRPFFEGGNSVWLAFAMREGKWGCIDGSGRTVIEPVGERSGFFERGLITFRNSGMGKRVAFLTDGTPAESDQQPHEAHPSGLVIRRSDEGKFGLYDTSGNAILQPKWDHIAWVAPDAVAAWTPREGGLFDTQGRPVFQDDTKRRLARFDRPKREGTPEYYQRGFVLIEETPVWGYAQINRLPEQEIAKIATVAGNNATATAGANADASTAPRQTPPPPTDH